MELLRRSNYLNRSENILGKFLIPFLILLLISLRSICTADWSALGMNPENARLSASPIEGFQEGASFSPS